jgi:hypothetical protein
MKESWFKYLDWWTIKSIRSLILLQNSENNPQKDENDTPDSEYDKFWDNFETFDYEYEHNYGTSVVSEGENT